MKKSSCHSNFTYRGDEHIILCMHELGDERNNVKKTDLGHKWTIGGEITSLAFSPDGTTIVSGDTEQISTHGKSTAGAHYLIFSSDSNFIYSLAYTPDGRKLVSGNSDPVIKIYDLDKNTLHESLRNNETDLRVIGPL